MFSFVARIIVIPDNLLLMLAGYQQPLVEDADSSAFNFRLFVLFNFKSLFSAIFQTGNLRKDTLGIDQNMWLSCFALRQR